MVMLVLHSVLERFVVDSLHQLAAGVR